MELEEPSLFQLDRLNVWLRICHYYQKMMIHFLLKFHWIAIRTLRLVMILISDHMESFYFNQIVDLLEGLQLLLFKVKDLYQKKVLLRDAGLELQQISLLLKLKFYHTQELLVGLPKLWHLHQHQHFQEMSHFLLLFQEMSSIPGQKPHISLDFTINQ